MTGDVLDRILGPQPPAFAILYRPETSDPAQLEILVGRLSTETRLADLPLPPAMPPAGGSPVHDIVVVVPYRQLFERGFEAHGDGAPLALITITEQLTLPAAEVLSRIPDLPVRLAQGAFDVDDETYADIVRRVVDDEIGTGEGSNFVIKRSFVGDIESYRLGHALALFRRLMLRESGTYWTFIVHTGDRTLVGASPERHISVRGGAAVMNPISGTYLYGPTGPNLPETLAFLADAKETDELYMVLDEELKMMGSVCESGGRVTGPFLKEMARLAHTEYLIVGRCTDDPRVVLRETLFAPTVTGSPLENACRVIHRYEPKGRGYYSGVLALIGRDVQGGRQLDSSILIRTADIDRNGRVEIGVGASLVRHSDPQAEAAETRAKAAGLLGVLDNGIEWLTGSLETSCDRLPRSEHELVGAVPGRVACAPRGHQAEADPGGGPVSSAGPRVRPAETTTGLIERRTAPDDSFSRFAHHKDVQEALARRNVGLADFWLAGNRDLVDPTLRGLRALIVDAEDAFTAMLDHQLSALGLAVTSRRFDEPHPFDGFDLVVMGPGPGDPTLVNDPKIARLDTDIDTLLAAQTPLLAVCLSHQLLSRRLGLQIVRRKPPTQGERREIDLFGCTERVGFYNTFTACSDSDELHVAGVGRVHVGRSARTGEVHALRGPSFVSLQFHAESVLTAGGPRILAGCLKGVIANDAQSI